MLLLLHSTAVFLLGTLLVQTLTAHALSNSNSNSNNNNNNNNIVHNQLLTRVRLRNEYAVLRHGQSMANVAQLIASSPTIATQKYGLSDLGKEQAAKAGTNVVEAFRQKQQQSSSVKRVLLLASDLLRAKETAEIVHETLHQAGIPLYSGGNEDEDWKPKGFDSIALHGGTTQWPGSNPRRTNTIHRDGLILEPRLRERWFGDWDGTSDQNYPNVWKDDAVDPDHTLHNVESVNQVLTRTTSCILDWDDHVLVEDCFVVCVAHGDVLQILQTAFAKMDGSKHRSVEHLETATLRCLELAPAPADANDDDNDDNNNNN